MSTHRLQAVQRFARPRAEVAAFFERPENHVRITPPGLDLRIVGHDGAMREGLRLRYTLRPVFGVRVGWESVITGYRPGDGFTDTQVHGPYARWTHSHRFADVTLDDGTVGTEIADTIEYELPLGPLGDAAHAVLVRRRLEAIFAYRARIAERLLAARRARPDALSVAVAGGSGFVGSAIADELYRRGERVTILTHRPERAARLLPDDVAVRAVDVTRAGSPADAFRALQAVDALVISLAFPNSPMENPRRGHTFQAVDADGTERLVAAAAAAGVRRIVYISGAGAETGADPAARTWFKAKWRAERAVLAAGIPYTIVLPTWVYGPGDVALNRFLAFARMLPFVPLTGWGSQRLAPVFVGDVAALVADSLRGDAARDQVFEIGGPETFTMTGVIKVALRAAGMRRPVLPAPPFLLKLAAGVLGALPNPPLTLEAVDFINQPAEVDTTRLLARMPRRLTPLAEGLARYVQGTPA